MEYNSNIEKVLNYENNNFVVIGSVQSGKTRFITELTTKILSKNKNVIILTRNSINDLNQLEQRLGKDILNSKGLFVSMASVSRLDKLYKDIISKSLENFTLIVDESDMVFKDPSRKFNNAFKNIQSLVSQSIYVSATSITCLFKVKNKKVIFLSPPENYIGADKIHINHDMINEFHPYAEIFKLKSSLTLHKTTPKTKEQELRALVISQMNKDAVCCTFNHIGYSIFTNGEQTDFICKKTSLNKVITILTSKFPHVIIIAGHIASRGLSFVSEDYSKHLTHQIMILGKKSRGDTIVQALRLLGIFKDKNIPTLFTDYQSYEEIMKYLKLQDALYKKGNPEEIGLETLYDINFEGEIPKRKTIYNNYERVIIRKTTGKNITLSLAIEA